MHIILFMEEKIILDKKTFQALSVDSRVNILKLLSSRNYTLTEIAKILGNSNSTIKEHLDVLVNSGLIKQKNEGRKWKYYKLTIKGRGFISPNEIKVLFAFVISLVTCISSISFLIKPVLFQKTNIANDMMLMEAVPKAAPAMLRTVGQTQSIFQNNNIISIVILVIAVLTIGLTLGYYFKKRKYIIIKNNKNK
jgi:DNA-binding transcriptional ArsR family regulator